MEGVYESKIPLIFQFINSLGSIIKLRNKSFSKNANYSMTTFNFEDLYPLFTYDKPYLTGYDSAKIYIPQIKYK